MSRPRVIWSLVVIGSTRRLAAATATTAVLLLAACSTTGEASEDAAPTRTVTSAFGEVMLPVDPQAALGMYTTDLDMLITLGIPLASSQPIRDDGYTTFPSFFDTAALEGITPFTNYPEFNYEAILTAQPDVILNGLGYDETIGTKLSEIAPTFSFNGFDGSDWRVKFKEVAQAFDRMDAYDAWTAKYQAKVDDVKTRLAAAGIDPVVGPVGISDGEASVSCYGTPCLVFDDLGLTITPLAEGEGTYLGAERLGELSEIDVIFTSGIPDADTGVLVDEFAPFADNALWQQLPVVTDEQIFAFDMEMTYGSPSGQFALLEVIEEALLP